MRSERSVDVAELRRLGILADRPAPKAGLLGDLRPKLPSEVAAVQQDALIRHLTLGGIKGNLIIGGEKIDKDPDSPLMRRLRGENEETGS